MSQRIDVEIEQVTGIVNSFFASTSARGLPFASASFERVIVFPTDGYCLTRDQSLALRSAGGEARLAVVASETLDLTQPAPIERDRVRVMAFDSYTECATSSDVRPIGENMLISMRGTWVALISELDHALISGSAEFMDRFFAALGVTRDEMMCQWIKHCNRMEELGADWPWVDEQLAHVYREPAHLCRSRCEQH